MTKVTDEMIMDLADGNLDTEKAKIVLKFIASSKIAQKKYEAFVKTSATFGKLNPNNSPSKNIPEDIIDLLNTYEEKNKNKFNLKKLLNILKLPNLQSNYAVATIAMCLGVFMANIYNKPNQSLVEYLTLENKSRKIYNFETLKDIDEQFLPANKNLNTKLDNLNDFSNSAKLIMSINNKLIKIGDVLKKDDLVTILILPVEDGEISLDFINKKKFISSDNNFFSKKVYANQINEIHRFRLLVSSDILVFNLTFKTKDSLLSKKFSFIIK